MAPLITVEHASNRFNLRNEQGQLLGYLNYHEDGANYFLDYVYVNPEFRGKSVGQQIVQVAIDTAQEKSLKPVPICGYAKAVMQRLAKTKTSK